MLPHIPPNSTSRRASYFPASFTIFSPESPPATSPTPRTLPLPHMSPYVQSLLNPPHPSPTDDPSKPTPTNPSRLNRLNLSITFPTALSLLQASLPSPFSWHNLPSPSASIKALAELWHPAWQRRATDQEPSSERLEAVPSRALKRQKAVRRPLWEMVARRENSGYRTESTGPLPPSPLLVTVSTRSPPIQTTPVSLSVPKSPRPPTDLLTPLYRCRRYHWRELGMRDRAKRLVRKTAFMGIRMLSVPMGAVIRVGEWVDERRDRKRAEERRITGNWGEWDEG